MLNFEEAKNVVKENIPKGKIQKAILYDNLYVFMVFMNDKFEGQMDPYYSVNINTGEFRDFSVITDGDIGEIMEMFETQNLI